MQEVQAVSSVVEQVIEKFRELPPEKQQEALDFIDFLSSKPHQESTDTLPQAEPTDFYKEHFSKYAGCVDSGHTDLSTNKDHMKDFGKV